MATVAELRKGLATTTVPVEYAEELLKGASSLWLSSDSGVQLAGDLALCYPELNASEVRARAVGDGELWRLTVVAHNRVGGLADTAAILSLAGYSIRSASATTWDNLGVALCALTIDGPEPEAAQLDAIGSALRSAGDGTRPVVPFTPTGRAYVRHSGSANGDAMISVVAPDQPGLLATICRWLADAGVSIEAAWITGDDEANDVFVVTGDVDVAALEQHLTLEDHSIEAVVGNMFADARKAGEAIVRNVAKFLSDRLSR